MTIPYASVDLMVVAHFPLTFGVDSFRDIRISSIPNYLDGIYRVIDGQLLRWLAARISTFRQKLSASKPPINPSTNVDLMECERFYADCLRESGLQPSTKPLPMDYGKPTAGSCFDFNGNFCVWSNTTPKNDQGATEMTDRALNQASIDDRTIKVKCPHLFPLCRGPGVKPKHVHSRKGTPPGPGIPRIYTEYDSMGNWFPIQEHWYDPDDSRKTGCGMVAAEPSKETTASPSISESAKTTQIDNKIDTPIITDLFS